MNPIAAPETPDLAERRKAAADLSCGISGGAIYEMVFEGMRRLPAKTRFFEFGAGVGNFLKTLIAGGFLGEVTGADIMARPADLDAKVRWLEADLNNPVPIPDASFDMIAAVEVIEHLENPRAVVRELARLLMPGGHLIITTPNQQSLRSLLSLLLKGHFVHFTGDNYPAHITALLQLDLERILEEAGLQVCGHSYSNDGGVPKMPRIKWRQVSFGLLRGRWFSDNRMVLAKKPD